MIEQIKNILINGLQGFAVVVKTYSWIIKFLIGCVAFIPLLIFNAFKMFAVFMAQYVFGYVQSLMPAEGIVVELTGLAGWLAIHLKMPEIMIIYLWAVCVRLVFKIILAFI